MHKVHLCFCKHILDLKMSKKEYLSLTDVAVGYIKQKRLRNTGLKSIFVSLFLD